MPWPEKQENPNKNYFKVVSAAAAFIVIIIVIAAFLNAVRPPAEPRTIITERQQERIIQKHQSEKEDPCAPCHQGQSYLEPKDYHGGMYAN